MRLVTLVGGRTELEYPDTQIVERMLACVPRGSATPGVRAGSGSAMKPAVATAAAVVGGDVDGTVIVDAACAAAVVVVVAGSVAGACAVGVTVVGAATTVELASLGARVSDSDALQPPAPITMS